MCYYDEAVGKCVVCDGEHTSYVDVIPRLLVARHMRRNSVLPSVATRLLFENAILVLGKTRAPPSAWGLRRQRLPYRGTRRGHNSIIMPAHAGEAIRHI